MMNAGLLNSFINGKKNTLPENIIVCVVTALMGTFCFYEYYYGETLNTYGGLFITAAIAVAWLSCAARSGRDGRLGFMIFSFLYWSVPYIYILWYDSRDNLHDYNKWLAMSSKIAKALLYNPFYTCAKKLGTTPVMLAAILLIAVMGMYIAGFMLKKSFDEKRAHAGEDPCDDEDYDGEYVIDDIYDDDDDDDEEDDDDDDDGNIL